MPPTQGGSKLIVGGRRRQTFPPQVFDWGERGTITLKLLETLERVVAETPEPEAAAQAQPATSASTAAELQHLAELRAQGVLSEGEFTAAKARVLHGG